MANFNEHSLEMSIMELFQDEGYIYLNGEQIHRERSEVLLIDDLRKYLLNRYAADGLTPSEVDSIILRLRSISGTIYEANKAVCKMICDGFIFNREDHTKKDIYIELIDFDEPEKNVFKIVNQFEIEGINNQLRIPDGIVFINGIPVVVLEFKSAVKENTTIMDAYTQLTVRYRRDIPELFKYNAFIVISDGANNKYGSFFSPYDFFYAWRKIEADDKELDGITSLVTMVSGLFRKERLLAVIKDFVYFPDSSDKDLKIVCRYPQYFAAVKLFENIKAHLRPEGDGKGGTYFGATGCGKSYTMLFLTRMLMKSTFFHGRQERHDLILVHHHRAHSIDDFKVFQLCLLVVQLLELSFDFGLFLFSLLNVREDLLILGIHAKLLSFNRRVFRRRRNAAASRKS